MSAKKYNSIAIIIHWLMAILILCMFILGFYMVDLPKGSDERSYFFATGIATQNQSSAYQSKKTPLILPTINYNYQSDKTKIGFVNFNASFL